MSGAPLALPGRWPLLTHDLDVTPLKTTRKIAANTAIRLNNQHSHEQEDP